MTEEGLQVIRSSRDAPPRVEKELFSHLTSVHAYVARRIGPVAIAEDITSEVFAVALKSKLPKGDPLPWLYRIARHKVADTYRRRQVRREHSLDVALQVPTGATHDQLVQDERALAIRSLVEDLPVDQREAILLFYVEECSAKQVAESMRRSERAVNSLLQRARQKLRESGRDYFQEDELR